MLAGLAIGTVVALVAVAIALNGHHSDDGRDAAAATGGGVRTVPVRLVDLDIVPGRITVTPGTRLVLDVTNDGGMRHDLAFPNGPDHWPRSRRQLVQLGVADPDPRAIFGHCACDVTSARQRAINRAAGPCEPPG